MATMTTTCRSWSPMQVGTPITVKFLLLVSKVRRTSGRKSIRDHEARMLRPQVECDSIGTMMRRSLTHDPHCNQHKPLTKEG